MTGTPSTRTPEPWPISQASAPTAARRAARRARRRRSGTSPATPLARQTSRVAAAATSTPGGAPAAASGRRAARSWRTSAAERPGTGVGWQQRGHDRPIVDPRGRAPSAPTPIGSHPPLPTVDWCPMREPDEFDAFYKDARDAAAAADVRADRRPPRLAQGGPRRVRRRLAPLAQGVAPRGPRGRRPPARLAARAAPAHRPGLAPREATSTPRSRPPSTRSASCR